MFEHFPYIIGSVMNKNSLELTQAVVDAFVSAVENVCFGGIEPEWPNEEAYKFWDALAAPNSVDMFAMLTHEQRYGPRIDQRPWKSREKEYPMFGGESPFADKTLPYISWSQEINAKFEKPTGEWLNIHSLFFECAYAEPYYP
jgi:hypothetical protein